MANRKRGTPEALLEPHPENPRRFSMGPAEIELHPKTYEAALDYFARGMMNPRGEEFAELLDDCRRGLLALAGLGATHEAAFVTGSGSNAVQAMCAAVRKTERVALLQTGTYSRRLGEAFVHAGADLLQFPALDGKRVDLEALEKFLALNRPDVLALIAGPTDTTTLTPYEEICALAEERGFDLLIDTISTFGSEPSDYLARHAGRLRAVTLGLNKALRCGVAGVNAAVAVRMDVAQDLIARRDSFLWTGGSEDLKSILEYHRRAMHKQTMSPLALVMIREVLARTASQPRPLRALVREYRFRAAYLRRGLGRLGLEIDRHSNPAPLMALGTAFRLPSRFRVLGDFMRALAERPVGGRKFDIYGEPDDRARFRFFGLGFPGEKSLALEREACASELAHAEAAGEPLDAGDRLAAGDCLAAAYFRGDSLVDFSQTDRTRVILTATDHEIGTYTDFVRAVSQALA